MIPSYSDVLGGLGIEIIGRENKQKCHYKPIPFKKEGLKVKNLQELGKAIFNLTLLRYYHNFYYCYLQYRKVRTISNTLKNRGHRP